VPSATNVVLVLVAGIVVNRFSKYQGSFISKPIAIKLRIYSVSQKNPRGFVAFFSQTVGNFFGQLLHAYYGSYLR